MIGYYAGAFASLPQKDISGLLRCFWKEDPFKTKWTLLAKAYSIIRDKLRLQAHRLDIFLVINAPFLGIIPAKDYMTVLGWELKGDNADHAMIVRSFVPDMSTFGVHITRTNQTVQDIIQHSFEQGYIPPGTPGLVVNGSMPSTFGIMLTNAATQPVPALPEEAVGTEVPPETAATVPASEVLPATEQDLGADTALIPQDEAPGTEAHQPVFVGQGPEGVGNEAANSANEAANGVNEDANDAVNDANEAVNGANEAANGVNEDANEAINDANEAVNGANEAVNGANEAVNGANETANGANEDANDGANNGVDENAPPNDEPLDDSGTDDLEERLRAALEEDLAKTRDVSVSPTVAFAKRFEEAGIGYPFEGHFNPNGSPDLAFDPYQGDTFVPYDISQFIEPEFLAD